MIELRRPPHSDAADAIAATLAEMVVAHRVVEDATLPGPVLVDGNRIAAGADATARFLAELRRDLDEWNRFQSDACYLDDDGRVC